MKHKQARETIRLMEGSKDDWVCICGNTSLDDGFYPCNNKGDTVEPTEKDWITNAYVCDRCGRIIDQETLEVVGQRQFRDYIEGNGWARLPEFKGFTVDTKSREFRKIEFGKVPMFVPFESEQGDRLLGQLVDQLDKNSRLFKEICNLF